MIAFALNSFFARLTLLVEAVDPASYTTIRLVSGALILWLLVLLRGGFKVDRSPPPLIGGTFVSALALFAYAGFFSFAYVTLDTGVGALILFACVQATMIGWALYTGERPTKQGWIGIALALAGLFYLVLPGSKAPEPFGALMMAASGIAWGIYSLKGRNMPDPFRATARNFIACIPFGIILALVFLNKQHLEFHGVVLAIGSGVATSALGYILWYHTLTSLTATKAAIIQLTVPVIAMFFGVVVIDEEITTQMLIASIFILGGVALTILSASKT